MSASTNEITARDVMRVRSKMLHSDDQHIRAAGEMLSGKQIAFVMTIVRECEVEASPSTPA